MVYTSSKVCREATLGGISPLRYAGRLPWVLYSSLRYAGRLPWVLYSSLSACREATLGAILPSVHAGRLPWGYTSVSACREATLGVYCLFCAESMPATVVLMPALRREHAGYRGVCYYSAQTCRLPSCCYSSARAASLPARAVLPTMRRLLLPVRHR